jgi:hypothetical protein
MGRAFCCFFLFFFSFAFAEGEGQVEWRYYIYRNWGGGEIQEVGETGWGIYLVFRRHEPI